MFELTKENGERRALSLAFVICVELTLLFQFSLEPLVPTVIPMLAYGMDCLFEKTFSRIGLSSRLMLVPTYPIIIVGRC